LELIHSGILVPDKALNDALAGGCATFNEPTFRDLPNDDGNVFTNEKINWFWLSSENSLKGARFNYLYSTLTTLFNFKLG